MGKTILYDAALKTAKALNQNVNHCMEYTDAYVFSDSTDESIGGNSPVVVLKDSGKAIDMAFYCDTSNGTLVNEFDLEKDPL